MTTHPLLVLPGRPLSQAEFARRSGVHPEHLHRLFALGLLRATPDTDGRLCVPAGELTAVRRIERLRSGLPVNYAALGLIVELLDRIGRLETALRTQRAAHDTTRGWIS
nr:chaperone modulator CbpM [Pseudonocardia sp. AL041005-10]